MQVVIDGKEYVEAHQAAPSVGIAITVRNREDVTERCLVKLREHTPASVPVVIVDDASTKPYPDATYRFDTNVGIPAAKNKCLELLMDLGCKYLILMDNDCYPLRDDWLDVFCTVLDKHPHVSAQFQDLKASRQLGDIKVIYDDGEIEAWTGQRGYVLAYRRDVIEQVGGFDPIYGKGLYEHSDLANRIFSRGLTTWRYASPKDSHLLVESLDQSLAVERTPLDQRRELSASNAEVHNRRRDEAYSGYVEYREQYDVVLTCLYTGTVDPQRNRKMKADPKALATLVNSAKPHKVVVLHDELEGDAGLGFVREAAPNAVNVYFQRWINALDYLEAHPEVRYVLVCDGTDVEILNPGSLFDNLSDGMLRVGSEHQVLGCKWMLDSHPDSRLQTWMKANQHRQLLNAGVLMGARDVVCEFMRAIVHEWADIESRQFWKKSDGNGVGDMAVFNYVAYELFGDRIVYGPHVTTLFKAEERSNTFSLIRHK